MIAQSVQDYIEGRRGRVYHLRDAAKLLATFSLALLALDADGLGAWATRMEVGPVQDFWLALIGPWQRTARAAGLTAPRRLAVAVGERLAERFAGSSGSAALMAKGWNRGDAEPPALPAAPPPKPVAVAAQVRAANTSPEEIAYPFSDPPPADHPEPVPAPEEPAGPATILLVGDSMMAANLASAISRALESDPRLRLVHAHREATGLARPDVFDWPSVVPELLAVHRPRLIICSFGGNDAQRVRARGKVIEYGGDDWDELYHRRVRAMMLALAGTDAEVLWLGLPPMRVAAYDERMKHLNSIFSGEARELARVTFQETASAVAGESGGFAAYLRGSDGGLLRARMDDGVHYAAGGAKVVAARVVEWIHLKLGRREKTAALTR